MDARYHGSGRWTPRRGKRELRFEYFPTFDSHRAHEGEALVWDPVENRLRAAHAGETYKFICEMRKKDGECLNISNLASHWYQLVHRANASNHSSGFLLASPMAVSLGLSSVTLTFLIIQPQLLESLEALDDKSRPSTTIQAIACFGFPMKV